MEMIDACPKCGGKNDVHATDCPLGTHVEMPPVGEDKTPAAMLAVACQRIDAALQAIPIDIALGALAIIVGRAQYTFQRDPLKRSRNLRVFDDSVTKAINMVFSQEQLDTAAREAAQKSDPIRRLNS